MNRKLTIHEIDSIEPDTLTAIIAKIKGMFTDYSFVSIWSEARRTDGFRETLVVFWKNENMIGAKFVLACIQRNVGGELEFHS